mgnify:CR=1 FL=1
MLVNVNSVKLTFNKTLINALHISTLYSKVAYAEYRTIMQGTEFSHKRLRNHEGWPHDRR